MRRRSVLVGAGGLAGAALAGCLGTGQESLDERPAENAVVDGLRTAIGEANVVALRLATAREEAASPDEISFDRASLQDQLRTSTGALDSASQREAAGDFDAELSAARTYVGAVEGLLAGSATMVEAASQLQGVESSIQTGSYDDAGRTLDAVQPTVDDARSTTTDARSSAEGIDADLLDPYGAKLDELTDGLTAVRNLAVGSDELATGYDELLAGYGDLERGRAAVQQQHFAAAESAFQSAESSFRTATDEFRTAREETDGELTAQIDAALCRSGALTDAAGHFEASAAAARVNDLSTAQHERDEGETDLQAADNCGG